MIVDNVQRNNPHQTQYEIVHNYRSWGSCRELRSIGHLRERVKHKLILLWKSNWAGLCADIF